MTMHLISLPPAPLRLSSPWTTPTALPHVQSTNQSPVTAGPSSTLNLKAPPPPPTVDSELSRSTPSPPPPTTPSVLPPPLIPSPQPMILRLPESLKSTARPTSITTPPSPATSG